jgi:hypothetical protein
MSTSPPGAKIFYTTNGQTPTASSTAYTGPITVSASEKIIAIGAESGYTSSALDTETYTIGAGAAAPTISPAGGTFATPQTVALADSTAGATIYFNTDGSTPTTASTVYTGTFVVATNTTVRAIAAASGVANSSVTSAVFTITPPAATPAFSLPAGTYTGTQLVSITDATAGATIYYTTDGSTPTTSSTVYSSAVSVAASETLQAIAIASGFTASPVASAAYTINASAPPVISFPSSFTATGLNLVGSAINSGKLTITDGGAGEAHAAWFTTPVNVQKFTTDFNFQLTSATADGFMFVIQNAPKGVNAIGGNGFALGYVGITKSVGTKFDIYSDSGESPDSTGFYINGANPTLPNADMSGSGVDLHTGDVMHAHLTYDGTTLVLTITDTATNASFSNSTAINIPSTVGANTAYVGFTGSTGGFTAVQNILNWTYTVN